MAERTVTAKLRADTSGYIPGVEAASKSTTGLALAQKEAAAAARAGTQASAGFSSASVEAARASRLLTTAQREAAAAAKSAAVADTEATRALSAAQKEAAAAAKDASVLGAERRAAAQQAVAAAEKEAVAAAEAKNASAEQAKAAKVALIAHRDEAASARETAAEEAAAAKVSQEAAAKRSEAYTATGKKMALAGAVLAAGFIEAEKTTISFDKALSGVQAVSSASAGEMDQLRTAALKAGADTVFTATEAADAEGELVKAGVSVADTLNGGLKGALSLAAAGQLSLADAATISANAMNTFKLKGEDVSHIADVYAAAANKSAADVKELGYAMQQGGLVASQTGLSFEDTTAVLAAFADRALKGADGGTSLKTMLEKLNAPSAAAAGLMDHLGITTYDASGKFVGITQLAGELHDKLGPLTDAQRNQALATIFGSDAIRAATILYNIGADGVKGYKDKVNDSGAAARMAALQMDNLSGDVEQLGGSLETALIKGGSGGTAALRGLTQEATKAVNVFSALPDWLQQTAVGFAGGSGGALLLIGGLSTVAGKAGAARTAMKEAAEASSGLKAGLANAGSFLAGPWGIAIAGATAAISIFASKHHAAKIEVASFTDAIKADGNALGNATTQAIAADLAQKGLLTTYGKLNISAATVTDAALGNADALQKVADATFNAIKSNDGGDLMNKSNRAMLQNLATVRAYKGALDGQLDGQQKATAATQESTAATGTSALETQKAAAAAKDAAATAMAHAAGQRAVADAEAASADATKDDTDAVRAHGAAHVNTTGATNAATAAAKAHDVATKSDAAAAKDAAKSAADHGKATDAAAKADAAAANAAKVNGDANATAAQKKKAAGAAARDAAAAARDSARADTDASRATDAAAKAADKHAAADDKKAKASKAAADASNAQAAADGDAAKKAADEAEAARQAAEVHKIGVTWLWAVADAEAEASGSALELDSSVTDEVAAMKDAKDKAGALKDALDALNGVHIAASKAAIDVQQRIADLTKTLHENGTTLDITTEKGRANMTAINDLASAANAHAQAVADESHSVEAGAKAMDASRDEFDKVLKAAGLTTDQIEEFNKSLLNTPKLAEVTLGIKADTSEAAAAIQRLIDKYSGVGAGIVFGGGGGGKHIISGYATGGLVDGVGTGTSDSNLAAVSKKEYILSAATTARIGVAALDRMNFGGGAATVVKPMVPTHPLASLAGASDGGKVQVELVSSGAETYFLRFLQHAVRVRGGNVQAVLGSS